MNHLEALTSLAARRHLKDLAQSKETGLGQLNLLPPEVVRGVKELILLQSADARKEILAEIEKKGNEAKMTALLGGVSAGLAGIGIGVLIGRALRR